MAFAELEDEDEERDVACLTEEYMYKYTKVSEVGGCLSAFALRKSAARRVCERMHEAY